jgi:hypothetical protein
MARRKGEAAVLTTTLLIAVSIIAGSFVMSMAQPQNYVPTADEPKILEKIDVVQVAQNSPTSILVGIFNTGDYDAVIDMIYIKDSEKNLVKAFQVGALLPVDEMANILLPTSGQDTSNWINFEAVTERGNSDTLQISTPVDTLPGYAQSSWPDLIGVYFNGIPVSPSELAKLDAVDGEILNATSQQNTYDNTTVNPLANQSYVVDPATGGKVVGDGGSELHLIVANNKACVVLGGTLLIDHFKGDISKFDLNIVGNFQPNEDITIEITCYDFYQDKYVGPGGNNSLSWKLGSAKPNINVTFGISNEGMRFVDPNNGNFSVMVNITLQDNTQNLKLDLAEIHVTPEYFLNVDGLFVYEIAEPADISKIQSITFNVTNQCNASDIPFYLKIYNYASGAWELLGTYQSSSTPDTPLAFANTIGSNIQSYIGNDRRLYVNFVPADSIFSQIKFSFDQASLEAIYVN